MGGATLKPPAPRCLDPDLYSGVGKRFGNHRYGLNIDLMTRAMAEQLQRLDAWWRAANYLAVGMIYLQDNPLLA